MSTLANPANRDDEAASSAASSNNPVPPTQVRFEYIDGLRGVAAIMVGIGHLAHAASSRHPNILGPGIQELADAGRFGVQIFFVLSGFVIAHSVAGGAYSFRYFGRFIGRRFVRLDLPYWSVILLELCLLALSGKVMSDYSRELPSIGQTVANAFYLQQYLGYGHILPVFWTLCYEVQFYLALVFALVVLTKVRNAGVSEVTIQRTAGVMLATTFVWSLCIFVGLLPTLHPALFFDRWFQFALGIGVYLWYRGYCGTPVLLGAMSVCVVVAILCGDGSYRIASPLVTMGTAAAIMVSFRSESWRSVLTTFPMQFLGQISYSFYLLHLPIGWRTTVLVRELIGRHYVTVWAYVAFFVGLAISILAAWIMNILLERPAIRLARRITLPRREQGIAAEALVPAGALLR